MSAKTPILITVPHYVNLGSPNPMFKDYVECKQQSDVCKGRKRRLDHLTWEEKLQRKKLKNRVAAQTSRDRKKSRMDDMEATINDLRNCNEKLKSECKMLRMSNKKLLNENCELRKVAVSQFSDCCTQNSIVDSTLSIGSTVSLHPLPQGKCGISNCTEAPTNYFGDIEDAADLSSEFFANLDAHLDIDKLEEFAKSLLQDITADMELPSEERQITTDHLQKNNTRKVVGSTPIDLESSRSASLTTNQPNIDQRSPIKLKPQTLTKLAPKITKLSLKPTTTPPKPTKTPPKPTKTPPKTTKTLPKTTPTHIEQTYTPFNDSDDCITIIISDDIPVSDIVTEIETTESDATNLASFVANYTVDDENSHYLHLEVDTSDHSCENSPFLSGTVENSDSSVSDCGYESYNSPISDSSSENEMSELWNPSVSYLFPDLV